MFTGLKYLVVGSGLYGAVMAERLASQLGERVLVIDKRPNPGGNCHSSFDPETGIEIHTYGSHIFHTSQEKVWDYINCFTSFTPYRHFVQTVYRGQVYPMPISLATINSFFRSAMGPDEAQRFIENEIATLSIDNPVNLEEKAISLIGPSLYHAFIKGYTAKQWEKSPRELPSDIITRLPVRFNYNTNYFNDPWQGLPVDGYSAMFEKLLAHSNIEVRTGIDFKDIRSQVPSDCTVIYTGMIDEYFDNCFGTLDWRSLRFDVERVETGDYQGCPVMNYADEDVPWTRIHEFKHYNPERVSAFNASSSIICREYSQTYCPGMEAYYPINNDRNQAIYSQYARKASQCSNLVLGGRLGCYRYWDMDKTIFYALEQFEQCFLNR
ncbi:UDP-galactopyranose mutase [Akkermansia sp. N21169]|uniref:UDP-galactopyranose mutase n=1 Tax=Akkermansia sp. N21169 TaxID=3040765 RepID=UPI00244E9F49|nr:UDP-galactopyranose mutase [Akkermansia sp. N21169]MDH3068342.1 UDP-galactopyranose mutase [Akkermansia sp. N21169]